MLDAWGRPYTSKTAANLQLTNLSARLMDTYTDIQYKDKNFLIDAGSVWDIFFKEINPNIRQRTPNNTKYETYKEWYKEYI